MVANFGLISLTKQVSQSDLYRMGQALERNAAHCCDAYMLSVPPAINVYQRERDLPEEYYPIVFVEDTSNPGTLGEHWFTNRDKPAARVLVENASGLNAGPYSLSETASHEILEILCNEMLAIWKPHPFRVGVEVAYECADPVQDTYPIRANGTDWQVSNFVTPHWYRADLVGRPREVAELERDFGYGLDWCKRLAEPGQIGPSGYCVMRSDEGRGRYVTWSEAEGGRLDARSSEKLARKHHRASRTKRLGGFGL